MAALHPAVPPHRCTTDDLQAVYPWLAARTLGGRGCYVGRDLFGGGSFVWDPWILYPDVLNGPNALILGELGQRKALDVATPIPTPSGWALMGELEVGQEVFDAEGRPTRVVGVSDVMTGHSCYEVVFSDGSSIVADAGHLWSTATHRQRMAASLTSGPRRQRRAIGMPEDVARLASLRTKTLEAGGGLLTVREVATAVGPAASVERVYRWLRPLQPAGRRLATVRMRRRGRELQLPFAWSHLYQAEPALDVIEGHLGRLIGDQRVPSVPVTTEAMAQTLRYGRQLNHAIAVAGALDLPEVALPIDPYVLGVWLGDGHSAAARLTSADSEMVVLLASCGIEMVRNKSPYGHELRLAGSARVASLSVRKCEACQAEYKPWYGGQRHCSVSCGVRAARAPGYRSLRSGVCAECGVVLPRHSTGVMCRGCRGTATLSGRLRALGVLGSKHIPAQYLRASMAQRRALLAGLLDTDGTVSPDGRVMFCSVKARLAQQVLELTRSLGYRSTCVRKQARLNGRDCGWSWTVAFTTADDVFRLTRKLEAHVRRRERFASERNRYRYVVTVKPVEPRPVRCIAVESPSHLYLTGEAMVPTHNSTLAKTLVWRQLVFGRRAALIDPSGEYDALCHAAGVLPVELYPGGRVRINPLDALVNDPDGDRTRQARLDLLRALVESALGRPLEPEEGTAVRVSLDLAARAALRAGWQPTLPDVLEVMLEPPQAAADQAHFSDLDEYRRISRRAAHALSRLVEGDLKGMFDGQTTAGVDFNAPLLSFNLRRIYQAAALGIVMVCIFAGLRRVFTEDESDPIRRHVVWDEAWRAFSAPGCITFLQECWKHSRKWGVSNIAIMHRLSDLQSAGAEGSVAHRTALGLLADSGTQIVYRQAGGEYENIRQHLRMGATEAEMIMALHPGDAIWRVGRAGSFLVRHERSPQEAKFTNTDSRMAG